MEQLTDYELLLRIGGRDADAFRILADRHGSRLYRRARSLAHHKYDAEDLVQETLLAAYRGAKNYRGDASPKTWLGQILARRAATAWRQGRYRRKNVTLDSITPQAEGCSVGLDDSTVSQAEQLAVLEDVIKALSPVLREVLMLREMQGLSYREIAQALKVSVGTVESRLWSARLELRHRMNRPLGSNER